MWKGRVGVGLDFWVKVGVQEQGCDGIFGWGLGFSVATKRVKIGKIKGCGVIWRGKIDNLWSWVKISIVYV